MDWAGDYAIFPIEDWEPFLEKERLASVERDHGNQSALRREGWIVLIVWECETRYFLVQKEFFSSLLDFGPGGTKCL